MCIRDSPWTLYPFLLTRWRACFQTSSQLLQPVQTASAHVSSKPALLLLLTLSLFYSPSHLPKVICHLLGNLLTSLPCIKKVQKQIPVTTDQSAFSQSSARDVYKRQSLDSVPFLLTRWRAYCQTSSQILQPVQTASAHVSSKPALLLLLTLSLFYSPSHLPKVICHLLGNLLTSLPCIKKVQKQIPVTTDQSAFSQSSARDVYKRQSLDSVSFSPDKVESLLSNLESDSATGPDGISPRVLKNYSSVLAPPLSVLFTLSFAQGHLPSAWKSANITALHKKVQKQIPATPDQSAFSQSSARDVYKRQSLDSVSFSPDKVESLLSNLESDSATGPDGISPRVLKNYSSVLAPPLSVLFTLSFAQGHLPSAWKSANITALHKKVQKQIPATPDQSAFSQSSARDVYKRQSLDSVSFSPDKVESLLSNLESDSATGPDGISPRVLKNYSSVLAPPLSVLFTLSFAQGHLPSAWKSANITALHKKVQKQIPATSDQSAFSQSSARDVYKRQSLDSVSFSPDKVESLLSNLESDSATGPDGISPRVLKNYSSVLAPPLSVLFTLSFAQGHLPSAWKSANITALHKKVQKQIPATTDQSAFSQSSARDVYKRQDFM
uniref:Uncharacterized protein n=1 Tax=Eptatretus burgeri TaxID=7764 RepID=A0A8C4NFZ4_EPTBU